MATLPDDTFFGNAPPEEQRAFWLDGVTQGAVQSGGDADSPVWTAGAAPRDALKQAQADAEYLTKVLDTQRAMREVNDPADVRAYEPVLRAANEARAAVFENPEYGHLWQRDRDVETRQLISTRFDEVSRERTLANTDAWLSQLNASALQGSGDEAVRLIDAGTRLMQGLKDSGLIDEVAVQAKQQHWVQNYAKAWIEMRPPQERLARLGEAPSADTVAPDGSLSLWPTSTRLGA